MKRGFAILMVFWVAPACAASISERPDSVIVTIYHDGPVETAEFSREMNRPYWAQSGLAFITETRTIDVPAGEGVVEFRGVASTIVPQTADIQDLPAGLIERNFDYDLLTPGSLLAHSIGDTVQLVRTDARTGRKTEETAIVRSAPEGAMLEIDGKLEALNCSGLPEKLVFQKIPGGLRDTPTLSVRTRAAKAGRYTVRLSYIATGLNWSADYVARVRPDGVSLDLSGFITLANFTATGFENIPAEVVAGNLELTGEDDPVQPKQPRLNAQCWPTDIDWATIRRLLVSPPPPPPPGLFNNSPVTAVAQEEVTVTGARVNPIRLGDYKLYALPERTSVKSHETKQVQFLDQKNVRFERVYSYTTDEGASDRVEEEASVLLRMQNTLATGLGVPLPGGTVSVLERGPQAIPVLAGQSYILDTSVSLPTRLELGRAIDVPVEQRITERVTAGREKNERTRTSFEIAIENDKSVPIAFELSQPLYGASISIVAEDRQHTMEASGATWHLELNPGESQLVRYTIEEQQSR